MSFRLIQYKKTGNLLVGAAMINNKSGGFSVVLTKPVTVIWTNPDAQILPEDYRSAEQLVALVAQAFL